MNLLAFDIGGANIKAARMEIQSKKAHLSAKIFRDCILIDVGSTTTDIIPIMNGRIASKGKTDLERLSLGELIYTGALRTNVAATLDKVSIRGRPTRISSELFATSGDAHLILGNITEDEYTTETADGRGKSRVEALARLSRVVCADIEMLGEDEILFIAKHIWDQQLEQIAEGFRQMLENLKLNSQTSFPIVVAGIGRKFLAQKAAEKIGFKNIIDLGGIIGQSAANAATCAGLAYLMAYRRGVNQVAWQR